jgi:chromosome segregation ATPase
MNFDQLPDELEAVLDRARAALSQEIARARTALNSLNSERAVAAKTLAELRDQIVKAEAELEALRVDLGRTSTARQLDHEIKKGRAEAQRLTVENAEAAKVLAARLKQCSEADAKLATLENSARLAVDSRCRAQETVAAIKKQLELVTRPA